MNSLSGLTGEPECSVLHVCSETQPGFRFFPPTPISLTHFLVKTFFFFKLCWTRVVSSQFTFLSLIWSHSPKSNHKVIPLVGCFCFWTLIILIILYYISVSDCFKSAAILCNGTGMFHCTFHITLFPGPAYLIISRNCIWHVPKSDEQSKKGILAESHSISILKPEMSLPWRHRTQSMSLVELWIICLEAARWLSG